MVLWFKTLYNLCNYIIISGTQKSPMYMYVIIHYRYCTCLYICHAHSLASPVAAYTTAGVALLLPLVRRAHAVILYWAPGTAGLIVTLLPLPAFTYSPIIGTPKRITSYPVIITLVVSSFLWTRYSTADFVTLPTMRLGTLRGSEEGRPKTLIIYF